MQKNIGGWRRSNSESDPNAAWNERQTRTAEARRLYEHERLMTWVTEELSKAIDDSGMTRSEVAAALGSSKSHVTQVLRGTRNLTLKSIAEIAWATGFRISVAREPLRAAPFISSPVGKCLQFRSPAIEDITDDEGEGCEMDLLAVGEG